MNMPTPEDDYWMRRALREASRAVGNVHPNPAVGCVVVRDGRLLGAGHTQPPPGPHAEVIALRMAGEAARGSTLYSTLEPCNHHGRTPPCVNAILAAGILRVVIAVRDPFPAASGGLERLAAHGVETVSGVESGRAERRLAPFLYWARTKRPYVVLKSAMTLDGKIASASGISRWITGPVARSYAHRLRQRLGAVMAGIGTALADSPSLTVRHTYSSKPVGPPPIRIIVDSRLRLPMDSPLVASADDAPLLVVCRDGADEQKAGALRAAGVEVLTLPGGGAGVDFAILMEALGQRGITGILLEGGSALAFSAVQAGCVNEVQFFVAPRLMGGSGAPGPLGGAGFASPDLGVAVQGLAVRRCGRDFLFGGRLKSAE